MRMNRLAVRALVCAALAVSPARAQQVTAIVGATVIDGNGGAPLRNATVVVTGQRITAVGAQAQVTVPAGARVISGAGKFVIPGLVDANVHVSLYGAGESFVRYEKQNAALALEYAQLHLKYGVTTIRDSYGSLL